MLAMPFSEALADIPPPLQPEPFTYKALDVRQARWYSMKPPFSAKGVQSSRAVFWMLSTGIFLVRCRHPGALAVSDIVLDNRIVVRRYVLGQSQTTCVMEHSSYMQLKEPSWTCRIARRSSASAMPTASRWRRRTGKLANHPLSKLQASLILHFQERPCRMPCPRHFRMLSLELRRPIRVHLDWKQP